MFIFDSTFTTTIVNNVNIVTPAQYSGNPRLAPMGSNGNFMIVFTNYTSGASDGPQFYMVFNSSGTVLVPQTNCTQTPHITWGADLLISVLPNKNMVLVYNSIWQNMNEQQQPGINTMFYRIMSSDGITMLTNDIAIDGVFMDFPAFTVQFGVASFPDN